jgi:putative hydrolase of the HAD superfamily
MTIAVVLFDLDDTLFAHSSAVAHGVLAHRTALGLPGDEEAELDRWTALEEHHYHRYLRGELGYQEMRRARARDFAAPHGIDLSDDAAADEWFAGYVERYRSGWVLYDDTLPLLDALPHRLGIITNAELAFQQGKLDAMGIADRFEHVIASGEVGHAKPDARIFQAAVRAFGVDAHQAAYVGDRLHTDAVGAAHAGLTGIWLDRDARASADELAEAASSGVVVITGLAQLPAALAARA